MDPLSGGELALTAVFIAYESAFAYSQFMPSLFTIQKFREEWDGVRALRQGEVIGTTFTLAFALVFSWLLRSPLPLVFAALSCGFVLAVYEWAIRKGGK